MGMYLYCFKQLLVVEMKAVLGNNFSGKSQYILDLFHQSQSGALIGCDASHFFSGISSSSLDEIKLHGGNIEELHEIIKKLNLELILNTNPYTLSGGQQIALAVVCAIASQPDFLGLDSSLEQVDPEKRAFILEIIRDKKDVVLADNRFSEYIQSYDFCIHTLDQIYTANDVLDIQAVQSNLKLNQATKNTLKFRDVSFSYPKQKADVLNQLSMHIESGRTYILDGANGTGKTTLSKILAGVLKVNRGYFLLNDETINPFKFPGKYVSYCFQNPDLQLFEGTVHSELKSSLVNSDIAKDDINNRIEMYAHAFGLAKLLDEHPMDLPFTLRKRLAMCCAFVAEKSFVILDEPTMSQDDATVIALTNIIKDYVESGRTVIVISHSEWFKSMLNAKYLKLTAGD